tara:strand:- start:111 stop:383 length:273 start_codon:yes stop_codon:yes gene_type:complete
MIDDSHKIAWVFGYMKAYFDLYVSMGTNPDKLSESMQFLTSKVYERLGIEDEGMVGKTIEQLDQLDIELTIAKVIKEYTDDSTKTFSITL